jgi:hypothetical protein
MQALKKNDGVTHIRNGRANEFYLVAKKNFIASCCSIFGTISTLLVLSLNNAYPTSLQVRIGSFVLFPLSCVINVVGILYCTSKQWKWIGFRKWTHVDSSQVATQGTQTPQEDGLASE